ncbi:MAG: aldose 1-epimerase family protein [Ancalomicrobiaceae bacterium]|nr:aldose 1-epimerase family protein [Ancalomicrobiaceae bacterium]
MAHPDTDLIAIASTGLSAEISPNGAELMRLTTADGRELLWNGDPAWWAARAPILFPIVGSLKHEHHNVDGRAYSLPRHGFARHCRFAVAAASPTAVTFRLEANETTLAAYPYRFRLDVIFAIDGATLTTTGRVENLDDRPIPVAFGYHPAFLWPLPGAGARAEQVVEFETDEPAPAHRIDKAGLVIYQETASRIVDRRMALPDNLFDGDALLYLSPSSRSVRFGAASGKGTSLQVDFHGMPHLGIWAKPGGSPFLCIEPWQGYASPEGFAGPLDQKPGSITLAPGAQAAFTMAATVVEN